ncbi:glycosyltransferase [Edwardsiella tarda]|uniref:glycosyltransferase n=1 Tax=Edwardsiella TaxID=635 RepID=UPI00351C337E
MNILHVVGGLSTGGIEKWLLNLASVASSDIQLHIYSTNTSRLELLDVFNERFSSVSIAPQDSFIARCKKLIDVIDEKNIHIVQSHCDLASGYYAFLVKKMRPHVKFITHCHSDRRFISNVSLKRKYYTILMQFLIKKYSTMNIAVSSYAKMSLFPNVESKVIYCGVPKYDLHKIYDPEISHFVDEGRKIIFHVARFNEAKNHEFILDLADNIGEEFIFVFLGEGEKFQEIKLKSNDRGLKNVLFKGSVDNVCDYLYTYGSLLILPSLWEGLPLTVIESQSLGVQALVSDNITKECDIGLTKFLKLDVNTWIEELISFDYKKKESCDLRDFCIDKNSNILLRIYNELYDGS